jgi:hypothetical protein
MGLEIGTRVRLLCPSGSLPDSAVGRTGIVTRKDEYLDYWIVKLDQPLVWWLDDYTNCISLEEVREDEENLEIVEKAGS